MTTLEIDILGPIGHGYNQDPSKDFTSESVASALASKPAAVKLRINSPGGDCFDALATYNLLRSSGAKVEVEVLGLAASAASLIAMAGDSVLMATGSMLMLHNPWTAAVGNSNDLREAADRLDKVRQSFLDIYQSKSGRDAEEVGAVMDDETWLTADEAKAKGFAQIVKRTVKAAALGTFDLARIGFQHAPRALITQATAKDIKTIRDFERFLRDAGFSRTEAEAIAAGGYKAPRGDPAEPAADVQATIAALSEAASMFRS